MRVFVAVWPSAEVVDVLAAHPRPDVPGLRWTTPDQWHVTLRFLGAVAAPLVVPIGEALREALVGVPSVEVTLGPVTRRLGRSILLAPVAGLDGLAAAVTAGTGSLVPVTEGRPFLGHLTLARARRGASVPVHLVGAPLTAAWTVGEVCLVRSTLRPTGAVYDDLTRVVLA